MSLRKSHGLRRPLGAGASDYRLVAWLFLRLLAAIYLVAFWSLAVQIEGLAGSQGIYPVTEQLGRIAEQQGTWRFLAYPSIFWVASGDWPLSAATYAGCMLSLLLLFAGRLRGVWERATLVALYALYLSLYHAGQYFTNFQWDYLLLETGFLAIFLPGGSRLVVWLFRWLLFRLRFLSGLSKLATGDPTWSSLTALSYYFETQPLPHAGAWYAHQLPDWLLRAGTAGTLVVEILVPLMMFLPRPWRLTAAGLTILWQVLIILTSNHNFFNILTIALCLFLLDDRALRRVVPRFLRDRAEQSEVLPSRPRSAVAASAALAAAVIVPASLVEASTLLPGIELPRWLNVTTDWLGQYRIANRYHVFPKIETQRIEVQIVGSLDGETWHPYEFRYWPVALDRRPPFIVPHQPRIDWMMWFVPISPVFMDWFARFLDRLLEASPAVTRLLGDSPFGGKPPRTLRIDVYLYRFTTAEERAQTGEWWRREYLGPFYPLPLLEKPSATALGICPGNGCSDTGLARAGGLGRQPGNQEGSG
jgi:hypothetical protein